MLLLRFFLLGGLAVVPALFLQDFLGPLGRAGLSGIAVLTFSVGLIEELSKSALIIAGAVQEKEFNENLDGIIYAITGGLGFAAVENLLYTLAFDISVGLMRAIITTLAHAAFSGCFGYFWGLARDRGIGGIPLIVLGILVAAFLHGAYNFLLLTGFLDILEVFLLIVFLHAVLAIIMAVLREGSPFVDDAD